MSENDRNTALGHYIVQTPSLSSLDIRTLLPSPLPHKHTSPSPLPHELSTYTSLVSSSSRITSLANLGSPARRTHTTSSPAELTCPRPPSLFRPCRASLLRPYRASLLPPKADRAIRLPPPSEAAAALLTIATPTVSPPTNIATPALTLHTRPLLSPLRARRGQWAISRPQGRCGPISIVTSNRSCMTVLFTTLRNSSTISSR